MMVQHQGHNNSSLVDLCIVVMIEDAIDKIEQVIDKHLKEGTYFYNIVIPKLDKLKQQI
jgi:GTP-binding protein EngB required for normal cell division